MAELMNETWEDGGDECPECGAPAGEKCENGCPYEGIMQLASVTPSEPDPDRAYDTRFEGANKHFDKFMGRILSEGSHRRPQVPTAGDSLQRIRAQRTQERPLNRIRMGGSR